MGGSNQGDVTYEERSRRIVEVAVRLAETGGFSAIRLREVAQQAGVALRTLYKRFPSKEDLVFGVLQVELQGVHEHLGDHPVEGQTSLRRIEDLFTKLTAFLCNRPNLARAVIRAIAAGPPALATKIAGFHLHVNDLVLAAIVGGSPTAEQAAPNSRERRLAAMMQHVWFASLVGWTSNLHDTKTVVLTVLDAASLVLEAEQR